MKLADRHRLPLRLQDTKGTIDLEEFRCGFEKLREQFAASSVFAQMMEEEHNEALEENKQLCVCRIHTVLCVPANSCTVWRPPAQPTTAVNTFGAAH